MNILFLTLSNIDNIHEHDIYQDLMREFIKNGHNVYIVSAIEKRKNIATNVKEFEKCKILQVKIGNQSKCSFVEKGISLITLKKNYENAIKNFFADVRFDIILYSTPPITLAPLVSKLKKQHNAFTYLMLKDIFPQNAVDLNIMNKKGLIYKYFRLCEKKLYKNSDFVGCMSPANVEYILKNNSINAKKVRICPNAFALNSQTDILENELSILRKKYNIPEEKVVFIYGGNLGKPQGIDFLAECLKAEKENKKIYFVIVGAGSEYEKLEKAIANYEIDNVSLINYLPRYEYYKLLKIASVGMIFLDYRFTIPNFPSRLLSYMANKLPVVCAVDDATDVGIIAQENGFGMYCSSKDVNAFCNMINKMCDSNICDMGNKAYEYMKKEYAVSNVYDEILDAYNMYKTGVNNE